MIEEVFEKAKQVQGAQRVEDMEKEKFGGSGFKLGQPSTGSTAVPGQKKVLKVITFWKNGFTINDGALRSYNDPQNKEFLADIQEGHVKGFIPVFVLIFLCWMNVDMFLKN